MHSHLLPGIDDGSPDTETSLSLIAGLREMGYSRFIATPHVLWDLYRNDDGTIEESLRDLQAALVSADQHTPLSAAAEYMIDDHFAQMVAEKAPFRCITGKLLLVEFSFVSLPYEWKKIFFDLQMLGYQPVLAHPERYTYLAGDTGIFQEIADMGILLQVNLNSLTGYYGKVSYNLAMGMIKQKIVSLLGTDCHHERHLEAMRSSSQLMPAVEMLLDQGRLLNKEL
ncbi:MAG: capsular biosynthesis protein [Bacteroidetes bacterium]|nr:capsular biosynthesis protein [Bacteroidota bacterium]